MKIVVTGANGQLGMCIRDCVNWYKWKDNTYYFYGRKDLDITNEDEIRKKFEEIKPDVVINCAGYTDVEKAENPWNYNKVAELNTDGPTYLALCCEEQDAVLIHISTDYVFDGESKVPYKEPAEGEDVTYTAHPLNQYGATKLYGDCSVLNYEKGIVIRTSWLYSEYGKNLYRTFLDRVKTRQGIKALCNRVSSPTYARSLANFIVDTLINNGWVNKQEAYGIFNYCNEGVASIYDFALAIETLYESYYIVYEPMRDADGNDCMMSFSDKRKFLVEPVKEYAEKVRRPNYSVLDCTKVKNTFGIKISGWIASLIQCMQNDGVIK